MHTFPCSSRPFMNARLPAGGGHIVNVGSVAGCKGVADEASYSATKWAIRGWSNSCYEVRQRQA